MTTEPKAEGGVAVGWVATKPGRPGVYGVRGFEVGVDAADQFEAAVIVRELDGELVCNLHESTSESDLDRWTLVSDMKDSFEWCSFDYAASPSPSAVEALASAAGRALDRLWYVNTYGVRNGQAIDADLVIDLKKLLQSEEIAALLKGEKK